MSNGKDTNPIVNAYIGPSGSGKTFLMLQHMEKYKRQIRLDAQPMGNADLQKGCEVFRTVPELLAYIKANKEGDFKACLYPQNMDLKTAFHWICKIAIIYREIAIGADEANRYISRGNLCSASEAVFFQSRHSQTRLFYTMFNPRYVSPEMRGNTAKTHIFKNLEKNVTDYLRDLGASAQTVERFTSDDLPKYSYALIETGKAPRVVTPRAPKPRRKKTAQAPKKTAKGGGRRAKSM